MLLATCTFLNKFIDNIKRKMVVFNKFYFKNLLFYTQLHCLLSLISWWNMMEFQGTNISDPSHQRGLCFSSPLAIKLPGEQKSNVSPQNPFTCLLFLKFQRFYKILTFPAITK